jgi:hypothetical protein
MKMTNLQLPNKILLNGTFNFIITNIYRSDEALELNLYIKKLGLMPDMCSEDYLI